MIRFAPSVVPRVKEKQKSYEKEKASPNSVKCSIERMAFKKTNALFAVKVYSHNKFQKQKNPVKKLASVQSSSKRPHLTGLKNRWL